MKTLRIAALADLHLGYRQFPAVRNGRNAREFDVLTTWGRIVDQIANERPDVVTIAGDVFHRSRVSNHAITGYLSGLNTILRHTDADIHIVQGNHEASRSAEVMCPNEIAETLRASHRLFTHSTADTFHDPAGRYMLTALPFETKRRPNFIFPVRGEGIPSILVIHGAIRAPGISKFYAGDRCPDINDLARHFDIICAGDLHDATVLENDHDCLAFYSGSIDFTSTNFWAEDPRKGWALVDATAKTLAWKRPEPVRDVIDFKCEDCTDAEALNAYLAALLDTVSIKEAEVQPIVRVVVPRFARSERGGISHDLLKRLKAKCLHFQLDVRTEKPSGAGADSGAFRARSVRDMADEFFADDPKPVRARAYALIDERWAG